MSRSALITGGTGFVGSHLAERLQRDGWRVGLLSRESSVAEARRRFGDRIDYYAYSGSTEDVVAATQEHRPDVVFHLASLFVSEHSPDQVRPLVESNLLLGTQLAEALCTVLRPGGRRLVNTGTAWQHYEGRDYCPVNLYSATKQAMEALLWYYVEARGLSMVTLKLFDTYGPRDNRRKLLRLLAGTENAAEPLAMSGGRQLIDLVYIDDVVEAFVMASRRSLDSEEGASESFAVTSGAPQPLREVVAAYERVCGKPLNICWGERPYRDREVMVPWTGGATIPGWSPRVGLEQGIHQVRLGSAAAHKAA